MAGDPPRRERAGTGEGALDELLQPLIDWLNAQPIQQTVRDTSWVIPAVQTIHILAVAIVLTGALVIALRGLEITGKAWSLARWHARFRGSVVLALWVLLASGLVMILAEPERELLNWIFRAKMLLVIATLVLAGLLGRGLRKAKADRPAGAGVRVLAVVVLLAWIGVATAGRWIAYAG